MPECSHGRPDHQELIQQLAVALHGETLPARSQTPESVWHELLAEVRTLASHSGSNQQEKGDTS